MDTMLSAVVSDLVHRLVSFIIEKSQAHVTTTSEVSRLQRLLLRAGAVIDEADGRRVTNRAMLLQLKQLREAIYRGYYVLDGCDHGTPRAFRPRNPCVVTTSQGRLLLQRETDNLEATLDGMKEFLLILMHCPPIFRQPYSSYMFVENCMFGRQAEKERMVNFLLDPSRSCLDVLPVVGPSYVGKTTLVEHVCMDELVRRNFSRILRLRGEDLSDVVAAANDGSDNGNHHRKLLDLSDGGRCLMTLELDHEKDVVAWGKIYHSLLRHGAHGGSKVVLISRMDTIASFGTAEAVRLARLRQHEYWYFFRVLAFGSASPYDHHPDLASIGSEIATEIDGYFTVTSIITMMLRGNLNKHFWRRTLWWIRKSMRTHALVFGEDPRHSKSRTGALSCSHTFRHDGALVFFSIEKYETGSVTLQRDAANNKTAEEVLLNSRENLKHGEEFEVVTQSHIPPYYKHVAKCVVEKQNTVDKCLKRKRDPQNLLTL